MEHKDYFPEHVKNVSEAVPSPQADLVQKDVNLKQEVKDANSCMLIGAGVGLAGIVSALSIGSACPLCVVAAPSLIGIGFFRRLQLKYRNRTVKS